MLHHILTKCKTLHYRCNLNVYKHSYKHRYHADCQAHLQVSPKERPKRNEALIAALKLVMLNNIFSFGDMTFKQLNGTAMGTPPAQPYATIYYGLHETNFLPKHKKHVIFYK